MAGNAFKFDGVQVDKMRKLIGCIFDQYEERYGGRKKPQDFILLEVNELLFNLSSEERSELPEGFEEIRELATSSETFRRFAEREKDNSTASRFNSERNRMAIAIYLTHPITQSRWRVKVTREELGLSKFDAHVPLVLSDFLNSRKESNLFFDASFLGRYSGSIHREYGIFEAELNVIEQLSGTVFEARIIEKVPKLGKQVADFSGWVLVTEDEALLILAKNMKTRRNSLFVSLAVNNPGSPTGSIKSIVFRHVLKPFNLPTVADSEASPGGLAKLSENWEGFLELNVLKLLRP